MCQGREESELWPSFFSSFSCWPCDSLTHIPNLSAPLLMHEGNSFWIHLTFFLPSFLSSHKTILSPCTGQVNRHQSVQRRSAWQWRRWIGRPKPPLLFLWFETPVALFFPLPRVLVKAELRGIQLSASVFAFLPRSFPHTSSSASWAWHTVLTPKPQGRLRRRLPQHRSHSCSHTTASLQPCCWTLGTFLPPLESLGQWSSSWTHSC